MHTQLQVPNTRKSIVINILYICFVQSALAHRKKGEIGLWDYTRCSEL
jgi:hypothetical protein